MSNYNGFNGYGSGSLEPDEEAEIFVGMGSVEVSNMRKYTLTIAMVIISAILFLVVLAWFDFAQTVYFTAVSPQTPYTGVPSNVKLGYAVIITVFSVITLALYYIHSRFI